MAVNTPGAVGEFELIEQIAARLSPRRADTVLGIGDDAALIAAAGRLAVATDTLNEGVHYPAWIRPADLGWKALAVNLSDLAAMGAEPAWALLNLTLPAADCRWLAGFLRGFARLARHYQVDLIGGDTTRGPSSITVTVLGRAPERPLTRRGARPGDRVAVTGTLGDAAAAWHLLSAGEPCPAALARRLFRPRPRLAAGAALAGIATAAIDVSDGLLADLGHLLAADSLGARLDLMALPVSPALFALGWPDAERWAAQCTGGDDYELCLTVPADRLDEAVARAAAAGVRLAAIGTISRAPGIACVTPGGGRWTAPDLGYDHFV